MKTLSPAVCMVLLPLAFLVGPERNAAQASTPIPNVEAQQERSSPANSSPVGEAELGESGAIELEWIALIPDDWRPDKLIEEFDVDNLSDDDPRASELMEKLKRFWKESPVVHDYDGKVVKLPGYVVPLEMDAKTIQEFLLVPYYGACIHVPPPPANQTVHVVTDKNHAYRGKLFDTVWVTGTMRVEKVSSELGEAGYRLEARKVEPFE